MQGERFLLKLPTIGGPGAQGDQVLQPRIIPAQCPPAEYRQCSGNFSGSFSSEISDGVSLLVFSFLTLLIFYMCSYQLF